MKLSSRARGPGLVALWLTTTLALFAVGSHAEPIYDMHFHAVLDPGNAVARVRMRLQQPEWYAREFRFRIDPKRHRDLIADGELHVDPPFATWLPPASGGELTLTLDINRRRNEGGYDALITDDFAILRADHLFPAARVRMRRGAASRSRLTIEAPEGWSVETRYGSMREVPLDVDDPQRSFSRPTGWLIAGDLGVRREVVEDRRIIVAGPVSHGVRRLDMEAMIHWTLPWLLDVFPQFPSTLLVVSAGGRMWRGGLSAPGSLYIHADRPLINERGTSTLLHEMVHVAGISGAAPDADWIVEGLADFFGLRILHRAGVITERRYERSLSTLRQRGREAEGFDAPLPRSVITARAVGVLADLDAAIRAATDDRRSLDDVARRLAEGSARISLELLRKTATEVAGTELSLFDGPPLGAPPD
jgi:hypothetical protein